MIVVGEHELCMLVLLLIRVNMGYGSHHGDPVNKQYCQWAEFEFPSNFPEGHIYVISISLIKLMFHVKLDYLDNEEVIKLVSHVSGTSLCEDVTDWSTT